MRDELVKISDKLIIDYRKKGILVDEMTESEKEVYDDFLNILTQFNDFDFYKEIIASYRRIVHELDMTLVAEYAYELPKSNTVMETLRLEVL